MYDLPKSSFEAEADDHKCCAQLGGIGFRTYIHTQPRLVHRAPTCLDHFGNLVHPLTTRNGVLAPMILEVRYMDGEGEKRLCEWDPLHTRSHHKVQRPG